MYKLAHAAAIFGKMRIHCAGASFLPSLGAALGSVHGQKPSKRKARQGVRVAGRSIVTSLQRTVDVENVVPPTSKIILRLNGNATVT